MNIQHLDLNFLLGIGKKPCSSQVVKADGSWPGSRGFKPWHRLLDGCKQFASYYNKNFLNKGSLIGHTKNKYKKKIYLECSKHFKRTPSLT